MYQGEPVSDSARNESMHTDLKNAFGTDESHINNFDELSLEPKEHNSVSVIITEIKTIRLINKLKSRAFSGPIGIPANIIKKNDAFFIKLLTNFYNEIMTRFYRDQ